MEYAIGAIVAVVLLMAAEFWPSGRRPQDPADRRPRRRRRTITRALRIGRKRKRNPGNRWERERAQGHPIGRAEDG